MIKICRVCYDVLDCHIGYCGCFQFGNSNEYFALFFLLIIDGLIVDDLFIVTILLQKVQFFCFITMMENIEIILKLNGIFLTFQLDCFFPWLQILFFLFGNKLVELASCSLTDSPLTLPFKWWEDACIEMTPSQWLRVIYSHLGPKTWTRLNRINFCSQKKKKEKKVHKLDDRKMVTFQWINIQSIHYTNLYNINEYFYHLLVLEWIYRLLFLLAITPTQDGSNSNNL